MRLRTLLPLCLLALGCTHHDSQDTARATPSASAGASAAPAPSVVPAEARKEEIKSVYALDAGVADPLAQRLCDTIHRVPERRRSECCATSESFTAAVSDTQCIRTLTGALQSHAATLSSEDVDRCAEAMTRATSGCDWVVPAGASPLPPECDGIVRGTLAEKTRCRSSLECTDGLRCLGLSAVDVGTCGHPKKRGAACNLATDTLAVFTREASVDRSHPECVGYCGVRQCKDAVATGGACKSDVECGRGRCEKGACTKDPAPVAAPRAEGSACDADGECRGACVRDGAGAGTCSKRCPKGRK